MKFKTAYSNSRSKTNPVGLSLTKQSFKKECDINTIMAKYQKTGVVDHFNTFQGNYEDLTSVCDYQTAMNIVIHANEAFASLPSSVRKNFSNDPQEFLAFASNPENNEKMVEMGLANPIPQVEPVVAQPQPVQPEPPEATPPAEGGTV